MATKSCSHEIASIDHTTYGQSSERQTSLKPALGVVGFIGCGKGLKNLITHVGKCYVILDLKYFYSNISRRQGGVGHKTKPICTYMTSSSFWFYF